MGRVGRAAKLLTEPFENLLDLKELRLRLNGATGKGVHIGILDTGVASEHPAMENSVVSNHEVILSDDAIEIQELDTGRDSEDHGTACAGIIHSLVPDAKLHNVCVLGQSRTDGLRKLIAGLRFAVSQQWDVINISLGTLIFSEELSRICDEAFYADQILIAAKDNRPGKIGFPASFTSVIGVDWEHFETPLDFTYRSEESIEILAKGAYIEAPIISGGSQSFCGSSFACPQISGVAARLVELFPGLTPYQLRTLLKALSQA